MGFTRESHEISNLLIQDNNHDNQKSIFLSLLQSTGQDSSMMYDCFDCLFQVLARIKYS